MSKALRCDWCGEQIAANEIRVKDPYADAHAIASVWHGKCYVRIHSAECLRALVTDDYPGPDNIGRALATVLAALDPERSE